MQVISKDISVQYQKAYVVIHVNLAEGWRAMKKYSREHSVKIILRTGDSKAACLNIRHLFFVNSNV